MSSPRILERLIGITDRACDRGEGRVSPLYMAVRKPSPSVGLLLREGYSPDAQDCTPILGLRSPLAFALSLTPDRRCRCVGPALQSQSHSGPFVQSDLQSVQLSEGEKQQNIFVGAVRMFIEPSAEH